MGLGDIFSALWGYLRQFGSWVQVELLALLRWSGGLLAALKPFFSGIWSKISSVARTLWNHLRAIRSLNLSGIWNTFKKLYERFQRWLAWYQRHIMGPLDRIRAQLDQLYQRFFAPIIRFLDALRGPLRILAIFNRKLAAKLDGYLFRLEERVMAPLLAIYKRVNQLSSYFRAIITTLGYFDRSTLVESIRRDASLIWEVLTNPRSVIYNSIAQKPPLDVHAIKTATQDYLASQTGDLQPLIDSGISYAKTLLVEEA